MAGQSPIDIAQKWVGYDERNPEQAKALSQFFQNAGGVSLDPATTAWCAAFLNSVLGTAGLGGTGSLAAKSFLEYGTPVKAPQAGDIVVFDRGGYRGHVGLVVGINNDGSLQVLGGNQRADGTGERGVAVNVRTYGTGEVLGYRRVTPTTVQTQPPVPATMSAALSAARQDPSQNAAVAAIDAAISTGTPLTNKSAVDALLGYADGTVPPRAVKPLPIAAGPLDQPLYDSSAIQAAASPPVPAPREMRPLAQVTGNIPNAQFADLIRNSPGTKAYLTENFGEPGFFNVKRAAVELAMGNDKTLLENALPALPKSVTYDPATGNTKITDLNDPDIQAMLAATPGARDLLNGAKITSVSRPGGSALDAANRLAGFGEPNLSALQGYMGKGTAASPRLPSAGNLFGDAGFDAFGNITRSAPQPSVQPRMMGRGQPTPPAPWDAFMSAQRFSTTALAPKSTSGSWDSFMSPYKPTIGSGWQPIGDIPYKTTAGAAPAVPSYRVSTQSLAANEAMTPTGSVIGADAMRALSDPNYRPSAPAAPAPSQKAETPPPVAARPVAPPPVYNWTTSSWLPEAPVTPANRPGTTPKPETPTGLLGKFSPMSMLSGFLASAMKPTVAPRGQFGQPLAVGGTYRNGAVWAADGSGYGGSPGQSTAGLKPGDRVYDTNTGEWGLKIGQPVTWTGGTSGNTSTATGTFQGTSTGRTYNVGQQYTAGGYVYTAMPDGTFKKV